MEKPQRPRTDKQHPRIISFEQQQPPSNSKIRQLGGIHLYNEHLKRHLCPSKKDSSEKELKSKISSFQNGKKDFEEACIQHEIKDFLEHRQQHKMNINPLFTSEVEKIIQTFKHSQINTHKFLQEHQNKTENFENMSLFSFEELFAAEQNKNKMKYTRLMEKVLQQFKELVMKEISKMRLEESNRIKEKESQKCSYGTQTIIEHQNQITNLKKELQRKEAQYNALYSYKRDMINQGETIIKNQEIKLEIQQALVGKLENEVASKNLQIRGLQSTLKQTQDRLFNKILELQRQCASTQARQSLSSIQQILNPNDLLKQNDILTNFLSKLNSKKKRYKQRAESILSVTQSLFSNLKDKDEIVASMADITARSMREIQTNFDRQIEESLINELQRISKKSSDAKNLFKILQIYKKTKDRSSIEKNSRVMKGKISNLKKVPQQRNSSILGLKADKDSSRGSFQQQASFKSRAYSKQKRTKKEDFVFPPQRISKLQVPKEKFASFMNSRKQSIEKGNIQVQQQHFQTASPSPVKQIKPCIIKSLKEIPIGTNKTVEVVDNNHTQPSQIAQNCKKLKKGVSFQLLQCPNLELHSLEVNICIDFSSKSSYYQKTDKPNSVNLEKGVTESNLQMFDKHRFSKNRLVKTKYKEQAHKKMASEYDSLQTSQAWNPSNSEKPHTQHNATAVNLYRPSSFFNQKQRFSCHTSQDQIIPGDNTSSNISKSRNSFSRMERSTIAVLGQNDKEMKLVKQLAVKFKNRAQYREKIVKMHRGCKQNCEHIRRYMEYFDRCRQPPKKQNLKLKVQNLNNNLHPLPALSRPQKCP